MSRMVLLVLLLAVGLKMAVGAKGGKGGRKQMRADVKEIKQQLAKILELMNANDTSDDGSACEDREPEGCRCNNNQLNTNLALNRPANQISTYHSNNLGHLSASFATDGSRVTSCHGEKKCAHTLTEDNPWWIVDLGSEKCVNSVIFVNRDDDKASHSNNFIIGLTNVFSDDDPPELGSYTLCGQWKGNVPRGATVQLQCTPGMSGRYVILQLPRRDSLQFGELEVYGCDV